MDEKFGKKKVENTEASKLQKSDYEKPRLIKLEDELGWSRGRGECSVDLA